MVEFFRKFSKKPGLSPGTLVHVGEKKVEKTRIRVISYTEKDFEESELRNIGEFLPYRERSTVTWLNIDGLHDLDIIRRIGEIFCIHPLVMEDIVNTSHRPKMEDHEDYIFVTLRMLFYSNEEDQVITEQFSLLMYQNFIISFQEKIDDVFESIRERLRNGKGRIRIKGSDYLAYALLDAIVDNYFIVLEKLGENMESIEDELLSAPTQETLERLHHIKRELISIRKSVWPLREVLRSLESSESEMVNEKTLIFLRDVYDHIVQIMDTIDTYRDMASGMLDVYLSSISNKMNEVMKVLTIIATIFIPLTFIAGIYGMNFKYIPELEWHWGYPLALTVMAVIGLLMFRWFRRKGFL